MGAFVTWFSSLTGSSDERAMRRVQEHDDHEAFAGLVQRWQEPIRHLCVRMTGDEHRAEDLAQETFVRVFANRSDYQQGRKFSTWLWRIALNLCHDEHRRVLRRGESPLTDDLDEGPLLLAVEPPPDERVMELEQAE